MTQEIAKTDTNSSLGKIENLLMKGDLSGLNPEERLSYYKQVCESLGLNYLTQPFAYQNFQGKETLYARKDCTDQLRRIHNVSIEKLESKMIEGVYVVTAHAKLPSGREDVSTGAVFVGNMKGGEQFANTLMKAETKAKRRVTLSICGLGMLDELEAESVAQIEKEARPAPQGASPVKPVDPPKQITPPAQGNSEPRIDASELVELIKRSEMSEPERLELLGQRYGVKTTRELSQEDRKDLKQYLLEYIDLQEQQKPLPPRQKPEWEILAEQSPDPRMVK